MNAKFSESRPYKCWVEIDGESLRHNIREVQRAIGYPREIVFVVKSDAYGHGAENACALARAEGVTHFGVAQIDEGISLRRAGVEGEILLLHAVLPFEVSELIRWNITPALSSPEHTRVLLEGAAENDFPLSVQVEINTGMNRLGFEPDQALEALPPLVETGKITIQGLFTHFRAATNSDRRIVDEQMDRFQQLITSLQERCGSHSIGIRHAASSQAVAFCPDTFLDAVRPGIILYGGMNEEATWFENAPKVRPVMSVYGRVLLTRRVRSGEWVHYGTSFQAQRDMTIAVIAIGYANGYSRSLSNKASVLVQESRAPIVGVVGMDMTIVDVSQVPSTVSPGDAVSVVGRQGKESITLEELASYAGTIPYEIATSLGNSNPRIYHPPTERGRGTQKTPNDRNAEYVAGRSVD